MADVTDGIWGTDRWNEYNNYEWRSEIDALRNNHDILADLDDEDEEEKITEKEKNDPVKSFFEAYDVIGTAEVILRKILTPILLKKHSERTKEEKTLLKYIMDLSKKEKPKIKVDRQEPSAQERLDEIDEEILRRLHYMGVEESRVRRLQQEEEERRHQEFVRKMFEEYSKSYEEPKSDVPISDGELDDFFKDL